MTMFDNHEETIDRVFETQIKMFYVTQVLSVEAAVSCVDVRGSTWLRHWQRLMGTDDLLLAIPILGLMQTQHTNPLYKQ